YAKMLGVTSGHLNDTVSAQTGRPAGALIRERILLEARRLLLHSELQIAEIAYHLGFGDPSYFARFFRREDGRPPGDFRMEIREKYRSEPESSA
ncbi:MAG: AraC family transcriptional regulator, partial [Akkermansiaceae bacterium]|nr:AraC family transcriptional regulator [Akkermansiaceae bacterium]